MRKLIKRSIEVFCFCLLLCGLMQSNQVFAANSDFQVDENGVLTKYIGLDTNVVIPGYVTSIGGYSFTQNKKVTSIEIPASVKHIDSSAFWECYNLRNVEVSDSNPYFKDIDGVVFNKSETALLLFPTAKLRNQLITSYTIPDTVTSIGDRAFSNFYDYNYLESISIPDTVTSIGDYAFYNCYALRTPILPNSITSIGNYAFMGCMAFQSINIPDSVTVIGDYTFYVCTGLNNIELSNSVISIGSWAFYGCTNLKSISFPESVANVGDFAFLNCDALESIYIYNTNIKLGNIFGGYKQFGTLYSYKGSMTEAFALENDYKFIEIESLKKPLFR